MALLVKICGLKTPEALDAALAAGADMVGFVFFPPSPRHLGFEAARALGERVAGRAKKVALSVDCHDADLGHFVEALKPDMLQLHGTETPERVSTVRSRFGLPVMKAIPIEQRSDLSPIHLYANVADWVLFDARAPAASTPATWRRLFGSPGRRPSMSRPASSVRRAKRIPIRFANSSARRVPSMPPSRAKP